MKKTLTLPPPVRGRNFYLLPRPSTTTLLHTALLRHSLFKYLFRANYMLDINLFRVDKGGNPDLIRASQRKRGKDPSVVDTIITLDREWVKLRFDVDEINKRSNAIQQQIALKMRAGTEGKEEAKVLIEERQKLLKDKESVEQMMKLKETQRDDLLGSTGNIVHEAVVDSRDEADNDLIRLHGVKNPEKGTLVTPITVTTPLSADAKPLTLIPHHQVLARLDGYDQERGAKVAGHRGYFLKDWGVRLNQALINYGLDFLSSKHGYTMLQTPFLVKKDMMAGCAQLEDFDEQLYKVVGGASVDEDRYLIATSEQAIACFHADEWFEEPTKELPKCYAGYSTCFRKEAGSHGKDTWGLFRIHQFEKVEQFVICEPEHSWTHFERMMSVSEAFYQSLGLSYRVIGIVSGALNNAAARKWDLEAWFPCLGAYKELVSCSNCTDYQARRLEIRCGLKKLGDREKRYVHCLNCTLTATERTLCCILENYQREGGLEVPEVLRPYLGGIEFIPYIKESFDESKLESTTQSLAQTKLN